jgi:hypothetical protein
MTSLVVVVNIDPSINQAECIDDLLPVSYTAMAAHQQMERDDMLRKHGRVRTKVAGDDEMLRTGFHNGTALEAGKIADSQPVDLFAPAPAAPSSHQQQEDDDAAAAGGHDGSSRVIAESEPVDLDASARGVAEANNNNNHPAPAPATVQGRQGMVAHVAGGRRLGRQA